MVLLIVKVAYKAKNQFSSTVELDLVELNHLLLNDHENLGQGTKVQLKQTKINNFSHLFFQKL